MRSPRLLPVVLAFVAVPALAVDALGQQDPIGNRPLDPEYEDAAQREDLEQRRKEQEALHQADACEFGCAEHEGLQTRPIPDTSLVGVVHRTELDDDVLTLRLRFYNDGAEPARLTIDPSIDYEAFYLQVGREKLFIRKDDDGELDAKESMEVDLKPGKMETWWAKFPAPPEGTQTFDLAIPPVDTFRNIPLEED